MIMCWKSVQCISCAHAPTACLPLPPSQLQRVHQPPMSSTQVVSFIIDLKGWSMWRGRGGGGSRGGRGGFGRGGRGGGFSAAVARDDGGQVVWANKDDGPPPLYPVRTKSCVLAPCTISSKSTASRTIHSTYEHVGHRLRVYRIDQTKSQ